MRTRALVCLALLLCGGCAASEPTACDGFADRKMAITAAEYRPCAGEILDALDGIESPLRAIVVGDATSEQRDAARKSYAALRTRIRRTGIESDYRSMRPGTEIVKWPVRAVSAFNSAAFTAMTQYGSVLAYPNADNFDQGIRAHEDARRYYAAIR